MSKMALQTWEKQNRTKKEKIISKQWMNYSVNELNSANELNGRLVKAKDRIRNL